MLLFLFGGGAQGITCADRSFTAAPSSHLASAQPPPVPYHSIIPVLSCGTLVPWTSPASLEYVS